MYQHQPFEGLSEKEKQNLIAYFFQMEVKYWSSFDQLEQQLNILHSEMENRFADNSPAHQLKTVLPPVEMELFNWRWEQYRKNRFAEIDPAMFNLSTARQEPGFREYCQHELGYPPDERPYG